MCKSNAKVYVIFCVPKRPLSRQNLCTTINLKAGKTQNVERYFFKTTLPHLTLMKKKHREAIEDNNSVVTNEYAAPITPKYLTNTNTDIQLNNNEKKLILKFIFE